MKTTDIKRRKTTKKIYAPSEIVREIFLNLPCKSLCRFKSVSKEYHSHVDDVQFIEEHRKRNMKASHLLIWDTDNRSNLHLFEMSMDSYTCIKTIPTYKYEFTLPSSYGMVCLHGNANREISLFNPSSEEMIPLPDLPEPFAYERKNKPCAPTPTTWCYNELGFGFDPKSRSYKVVQLIVGGRYISRFHILAVARDDSSWRTVDVSSKYLECFFRFQPLCVDGMLYWEICITLDGVYIDILAFDLGAEEMKIIQSPVKWRCDIYGNLMHLALLEGGLCCYEMTPPTDVLFTMNIWKLKYDFSNDIVEWTLGYKLEIFGFDSMLFALIPLYIHGDGRILFQARFSEGLYCYHIGSRSLNIYSLVGKVEGAADRLRLTVHSETLSNPLD